MSTEIPPAVTNSQNDDMCDEVYRGCFLEEFKEAKEVTNIIANLSNIYKDQIAVERALERFQFVVDLYQEQPHLLDPHLESILGQLLSIVKDETVPNEVSQLAFQLLYLITKTRGYKVIVRLMPHEVADLEPVLLMLSKQDCNDLPSWQTRYMLLLWLSIIIMIPFDMYRLDGASDGSVTDGGTKTPITQRIIEFGKVYLDANDKSRDSAAYMLAKFITRPDVKKLYLSAFLDWSLMRMRSAHHETLTGQTNVCGVLMLLAGVLKHGKRDDLIEFAPTILQHISELQLHQSSNILLRKLTVKVVQRIGLCFLKARVATWRYQRGRRLLTENLSSGNAVGNSSEQQRDGNAAMDDDDYEVPDLIEEIIEKLLSGLKDKDTIVRWSAAKGIGRITGRLPKQLADEVVGALMELFSPLESESAWHGGCLSLAELGRRGLLLPSRLPDVIPVLAKALVYDEKCGHFSFGANVRDAACYICWSFARAYDACEVASYVETIASMLVVVSVFDREVTVRRAAAAAFQENVGRQGQFPHGIDILSVCDYFAVGNRVNCYLELSVYVAQFPEYTVPLIDHLLEFKIGHWDIAVRELTAESLNRLTVKAPKYMASNVLPQLLKKCLSPELDMHHGAVVALAHVLHALYQLHTSSSPARQLFDVIDESVQQDLLALTSKLQEARYFKGSGSEVMRRAFCCLIEKMSLSKVPFNGLPVIEMWQNFIDECLIHIDENVQAAAVNALPAFFIEYYTAPDGNVDSGIRERILGKYLKELLESSAETTRCGCALALGALPQSFLSGQLDMIITKLVTASKMTSKQAPFVFSRRDCLKALSRICKRVGVDWSGSADSVICRDNIDVIYDTFFLALSDYTLDSRGDVGRWIREVAMTGLQDVTELLLATYPEHISPDVSRRLFCELMQQACEKIDKTRAHAGEIFARLLYHSPEIPNIPHKAEVQSAFPKDKLEYLNWASSSDTFPKFAKLLSVSTYTYHILLGLTVSAGGLTESLVKHGGCSLREYMYSCDVAHTQTAAETFISIFRDFHRVDRVTLPLLKTLDHLMSSGCFSRLPESESNAFASSLIELLKTEVSRCNNVQKLLASTDVYCNLLQFVDGDVQKLSLSQLMILLCHAYPIVRKNTATKLYESILTYPEVIPDESVDEVTSLLIETLWDEPLETVRPIRNQLCDILQVKRPVILSKKS